MLGSIIPARGPDQALLEPIDWDKARVIVGVRSGCGWHPAEILRRMRPDAHLIAIRDESRICQFPA